MLCISCINKGVHLGFFPGKMWTFSLRVFRTVFLYLYICIISYNYILFFLWKVRRLGAAWFKTSKCTRRLPNWQGENAAQLWNFLNTCISQFICTLLKILFIQRVDCKVKEKRKTGLDVVIQPSGVSAFLPRIHLSDSLATCDLMMEAIDIGSVLNDCVYFSLSNVLVSLKC